MRRPPIVDGWYDDARYYIPTDVALRWAGNGLSNKALFEALDRAGLIAARGKGGRGSVRSLPNGKSLNRGTAEVPPETADRGGVGITAEDVGGNTLAADAVRMVLRASGVYALARAPLTRGCPLASVPLSSQTAVSPWTRMACWPGRSVPTSGSAPRRVRCGITLQLGGPRTGPLACRQSEREKPLVPELPQSNCGISDHRGLDN